MNTISFNKLRRRLLAILQKSDTAQLDAKEILNHVFDCKVDSIMLNTATFEITEHQIETAITLAKERASGKSIAKIIGHKGFWTSDFNTSSSVLDPRPDSETLIGAIKQIIKPQACVKILDLGSGTGCLGISLLQEYPLARAFFVDISHSAARTTLLNCANLKVINRSSIKLMDYKKWIWHEKFDIIVSNPPYLSHSEVFAKKNEIQNDPRESLLGGFVGHEIYNDIGKLAEKSLSSNGILATEIGHIRAISTISKYKLSLVAQFLDLSGSIRALIFRNQCHNIDKIARSSNNTHRGAISSAG